MANYKVKIEGITFDCFGMTKKDGTTYIGCTEGTTIALKDLDTDKLFMKEIQQGYLNLDKIYEDMVGYMYKDKYLFMTNFTYDCLKLHPIERTQLHVKEIKNNEEHVELKVIMRHYTKRITIGVAYRKDEVRLNGLMDLWVIIQKALNTTRVTEDYYLDKVTGISKATAKRVYRINEKVEKQLKELYGAYYGEVIQAIKTTNFQ